MRTARYVESMSIVWENEWPILSLTVFMEKSSF